ncbi:MAG TPA: hypothetical protein PLX20_02560 [Rhodocyclaceae bacterium]|nr:hypothetical protein [Rhodocyclaceae bacterium]HMV52705.1 hypothetical protein [Rhodocyclaceae bacterium]HNB78189.1 hypothetical protein [Rhodocyclaceae bacterium]HNC60284.1 hypothetical protein [Rhodocyclaceae bacterium]HNH11984.1 hypothetical protein [Rhodocyclaceae bacterium]
MRIKSHWFREEKPKSTREIAGASAFIAWRIAQNVLKNMRRADFEIEPGEQYFAFLAEWLIFLVQIGDRIAYSHLGPQLRVDFTSSMANRLGEILADNHNDLLGGPVPGDGVTRFKSAFIDRLNLRSADYADFDFSDTSIEYGFLRYLADHLTHVLRERDKVWVHDQVMELEAPEAVALMRKGMRGLLGEEPNPARARTGTSGE